MDYTKLSYENLIKEENRLEEEYHRISDECAENGLKYAEFQNKAHDVKEKLYFISKYKRLKQSPTVDYGKNWDGELITIEKFKELCETDSLDDGEGFGRYATENAVSNIVIFPSDAKEKIMRTDFTHVMWFNKNR